jgi:histone acetyltransferase
MATAARHRGATFKEFKAKGFIELVFCVVLSTAQVSGYGSLLMAHLKVPTLCDWLFQLTCSRTHDLQDYVRAKSGIQHVLTYADDTAIGYFKKQGFTKKITLEESKWSGFVKSYESATFMQCTLLPRIRYVNEARLLALQKDAILKVMEARLMPRVVYPPPAAFANGPTKIDPKSIPAIGTFFPS